MTNHILWLLLPFDIGLALHTFGVCAVILLIFITEAHVPEEPKAYIPKKRRPPESWWIKVIFQASNRFLDGMEKMIMNIKTRRRYRPRQLRTCGRRTRQKKPCSDAITPVINMTSTWSNQWPAPRAQARQFDSDSYKLMLDDRASACITNCKDDFVEPPKRVDRKVKGIKGHDDATHRGTLMWYLEDDTGLVHVILIQGAYLIPDATTRILSPQHFAQQANDHYPKEEGTGSLTTSKNITLFWSQRRFTKTVPLDSRTNVGLTTTAPGTRSYRAYCATIDTQETEETNIFTTHIIPDNDEESFQPKDPVAPPDPDEEPVASPEQSPAAPTQGPKTTIVDLGPIPQVIPDDPEPTSLSPHDELLRWHYRLGHLPFEWVMLES